MPEGTSVRAPPSLSILKRRRFRHCCSAIGSRGCVDEYQETLHKVCTVSQTQPRENQGSLLRCDREGWTRRTSGFRAQTYARSSRR